MDDVLWQYTAIDVASAYAWAELHVSARNPSAKWITTLARRVAQQLRQRGWKLETILSDNGNEFGERVFSAIVEDELGATHRRIPAGRPQSNGCGGQEMPIGFTSYFTVNLKPGHYA